MKVLTLREPWASLIGCGIKTIETRSWSTKYRGELYIHAGNSRIKKKDVHGNKMSEYIPDQVFHYGMIFCKCNLIDCVRIDADFVDEVKRKSIINFECGNYNLGRYAWILTDIEYIEPIKATGRLSIWNYEKNQQQ